MKTSKKKHIQTIIRIPLPTGILLNIEIRWIIWHVKYDLKAILFQLVAETYIDIINCEETDCYFETVPVGLRKEMHFRWGIRSRAPSILSTRYT